jgi:amidohydrolase
MVPTLKRVAGVVEGPRITASEDFSFYAKQVPGLFFHVGITPAGVAPVKAAPNHSPRFQIDEAGLLTGLRSILHVTFDYMSGPTKKATD